MLSLKDVKNKTDIGSEKTAYFFGRNILRTYINLKRRI